MEQLMISSSTQLTNTNQKIIINNVDYVFPLQIKNLNYALFAKEDSSTIADKQIANIIAKSNNPNFKFFIKDTQFWKKDELKVALNYLITKLNANLGQVSSLFLSNNNGQYVHQIAPNIQPFNQGVVTNYLYEIKINPDNLMAKLFSSLQINICVNNNSQRISGAFIPKFNWSWFENNFHNNNAELIYFLDLFQQNILEQLFPLSMENVMEIIDPNYECSSHQKAKVSKDPTNFKKVMDINNFINLRNISINSLYDVWDDLFEKKFALYRQNQSIDASTNECLKNEFFYGSFFMLGIFNFILYELSNLLTSDGLCALIHLDTIKDIVIKTKNQELNDFQSYLQKLIQLIHELVVHNNSVFTFLNKKGENIIIKQKPVSLKQIRIDFNLTKDSLLYNVKIAQTNLIHMEQLIDNDDNLTFLLLTLYPELFMLNLQERSMFPTLKDVYAYVQMMQEIHKNKYKQLILHCLCENNYAYYSLMHKQIIILFENNIYDQQANQTFFKLNYYYYIAIGFVHARLVELVSLRKIENYIEFTNEIKWKNIPYHKLQRDLIDLDYEDDSINLFATQKLEVILRRMNDEFSLHEQIKDDEDRLRNVDELFKRGIERSNFVITFIVAILVGVINYMAQVYSEVVLNPIVQLGYPGIDAEFNWGIMTITISSICEFIMLLILFYAFYRMIYFKVKLKEIDDHKLQLF